MEFVEHESLQGIYKGKYYAKYPQISFQKNWRLDEETIFMLGKWRIHCSSHFLSPGHTRNTKDRCW